MKTTLLICLVALFNPVFSHEKTKDSEKIGYYVFVRENCKIHQYRNESLDSCYIFIRQYKSDFCANLESELKCSPAFLQVTICDEIYVERKRIVKNGKYKRLRFGYGLFYKNSNC